MESAITFAAVLAALYAAHSVADHWFQTDHQAVTKSKPGRDGQLADARHVATYTASLTAVLLLVQWRTGITLDPARTAAALTLNAVTHYWADRHVHLIALARKAGKGGWLDHDPKGARYALDQSWHKGWLLITALIIA